MVSLDADSLGVVYFNVEYRLAPRTKCPKNALDFYCAVKHIIEIAKEFGVDPNRIAIAGDSGGGYIVMAAMALHDEGRKRWLQRNEKDMGMYCCGHR